jgi:hypothetical protein
MVTHFYCPILEFRVRELIRVRCTPNFNDLAWQTFNLLTYGLLDADPDDDFYESDLPSEYNGFRPGNPGEDEMIAALFRVFLSRKSIFRPGTVYANPCGVIRAPNADPPFLKLARLLQKEWYCRFGDTLGSPQRVKQVFEGCDPIIRQLMFTGVLFIESRHIFPDKWPDTVQKSRPEPRVYPGQRFGKLTVLQAMSQGQVRCKCDCEAIVVKLRKHLVSGQTKACGCTQAARQDKRSSRRRNRGWNHSGTLGS